MARHSRRRRRWRRLGRLVVVSILLTWIVLGAMAGPGFGYAPWHVLIIPAAIAGALLVAPFMLLGLVIAMLTIIPFWAFLALVVGGPLYLIYRFAAAGQRGRSSQAGAIDARAFTPETLLRRRYIAGELTYEQFRSGMIDLLKERFARGQLALSEYEAELDKLLKPARHLDLSGDRSLAGPDGPSGR